MEKVDILLGTYNGESFLQEQIDSILAQSYSNWNLIIRDDGSSDKTPEIILKYVNFDKRITLIKDNKEIKNAALNFIELLKYSKSNYVCFCDQDDIWLNNKLEVMLDILQKKNNNLPQVLFSDGYLYYGDKSSKSIKLLHSKPKKLKETLFCNGGIHGSLSMFNSKMRDKMLLNIPFIAMHDHLLTLIGCAYNTIDYLEIPTFYYRQHSNNVTPHISKNFFGRIAVFLSAITKTSVIDYSHYKGVVSFYDTFSDDLSLEDKLLCKLYIKYPNVDYFSRFFSIIINGFSLNNSKINLYIKLMLKKYIS